MKPVVFRLSFIAFLLALILTGCKDNVQVNDTIIGSGRIVSQERTLSDFNGINAQSVANVVLTQGAVQSVRVEADDNIIDNVTTVVDHGVLMAGLKGGSYSGIKLTIYVTARTVNSLVINGAANINTGAPIDCDVLDCLITGSGNIKLQGKCNVFSSTITGTGNISAENFVSKKCYVTISGTGNATINASEDLVATINGVGSVFYYGNPVVKSTITGTGIISKK